MIPMWTIYDHPRDFPEKFVARRIIADDGGIIVTQDYFTADTLEAIRAQLPQGMVRMERWAHDDPVIVETWL